MGKWSQANTYPTAAITKGQEVVEKRRIERENTSFLPKICYFFCRLFSGHQTDHRASGRGVMAASATHVVQITGLGL